MRSSLSSLGVGDVSRARAARYDRAAEMGGPFEEADVLLRPETALARGDRVLFGADWIPIRRRLVAGDTRPPSGLWRRYGVKPYNRLGIDLTRRAAR